MKMLRNIGYNLFYQVLTLILPLVTIPYVSRVLGPIGIGEYSFSNATTQYFVLFGMLGMKLYGSRAIAQVNHKADEVKDTFWNLYWLQLITGVLSYGLYMVLFGMNFDEPIYFAQSFLVMAILFDISWLFTGLEDFKKIVFRDTAVKILGLLAIFLFVKTQDDLIAYTLILSLSTLFGQVSMWFAISKIIGKPKLKISETLRHLKPTLLIFLPQIASSVYMILDRTMIGLFNGVSDVAMYDQAQKIIRVTLSIVPALSIVLMPRIANMIAQKKVEEIEKYMTKSGLFIIIISVGISFGLAGVAKSFVPWFFGDEFLPVIDVFYLSVWIVIAVGGANLFAIQYLIPSNQQNKYTITIVISAVINIILNLLLLPKIGFYGAAISTTVAEFVGVSIQIYFVKQQLNVKKILRPLPKAVFAGIIMCLTVYIIGELLEPVILTTLIQVVIGGIVYLGILFLGGVITKTDFKI